MENAADLWQKTTGLCRVKHATIGYTLSARASLRQSIQSYVVTTIHGYAMTAKIFKYNSKIPFSKMMFPQSVKLTTQKIATILNSYPQQGGNIISDLFVPNLNINSIRHKIDYIKDILIKKHC